MRTFFAIILLLVSLPVHGMEMIGFGTGTSCATQHTNVSQTTVDASWPNIYNSNGATGQSFQVSATRDLYAIKIKTGTDTGSGTANVRVGTSTDLTSYVASGTFAYSANSTVYTITFSEPRASLTASTTYYVGIQQPSADWANRLSLGYDDASNPLASGQKYNLGGTTWNLGATDANSDYYIEVVLCGDAP